MKSSTVPRKHRKHVMAMIKEFKNGVGHHDNYYTSWEEFLIFKYIGLQDGWIKSNDKEYQALRWLRDINSFIRKMNSLWEGESE